MNAFLPCAVAVFALVLAPLAGRAAEADNSHAAHRHAASGAAVVSAPPPAGQADASAYFSELELLTQAGRKVRFHADMLAGRTVLINVIYTSCKDACPLLTQQLVQVRQALPPGLFGQQVFFVSLSSDPLTDTPQALEKFARQQGADTPGWSFLTGRKENVEHILKKLGQYSETVEGHSTLFIAGNVPARRWSKIRPDTPPALIAERLVDLAGASPRLAPRAGNHQP
jgi:cytochrome oxidase Cu insertion factor (SCO1/SenC/PrrC family)